MDRQQALAALEWRKLQCRASPLLAPRRPRRQGPADSPDTRWPQQAVARTLTAARQRSTNKQHDWSPNRSTHHVLRARAQRLHGCPAFHPAADVVSRHPEIPSPHRQRADPGPQCNSRRARRNNMSLSASGQPLHVCAFGSRPPSVRSSAAAVRLAPAAPVIHESVAPCSLRHDKYATGCEFCRCGI
jgi:hypothetical protein